jgi:hypothetical protein
MGDSAEFHYGPVSAYSIKTVMDTSTGPGFVWCSSATVPVAALSNTGRFQLAQGITASSATFTNGKSLQIDPSASYISIRMDGVEAFRIKP